MCQRWNIDFYYEFCKNSHDTTANMKVSADLVATNQIGKLVRVWDVQYNMDNSFKIKLKVLEAYYQ